MNSLNSLPLSEAHFELEHSWIFVRVLVVCSLWSIFSLFLSDFHLIFKIILSLIIIVYLIYSSYSHFHAHKTCIYFQNSAWALETASRALPCAVCVHVLLDLGLFVLIRFKTSSVKHYLIVFEDQWSNEKLRCFMALYHMLKKQNEEETIEKMY